MKDPFEAAFQEQDSPPDSPEDDATAASAGPVDAEDYDVAASSHAPQRPWSSTAPTASISAAASWKKLQVHKEQEEEDEEEEEDHMEVVVDKLPSSTGNRDERNMNAILSQFTPEQLDRFEAFRRSGFQKSSMRRILASITGNQNMSMQTTIVVSGIAKILVGELTETARIVMTERKDSGPIRPCHIREAYRRLKLEGKIPRRSVPRLFR